jgi:hypothetical protein
VKDPETAKLLAGYATRTLTADEEKRLFRAAAEDQELFDELADEEDLREVLDDFPLRQRVSRLVAERTEPVPALKRLFSFTPWHYAFAGAAVAALVFAVAVRYEFGNPGTAEPGAPGYQVPLSAGLTVIPMREIEILRRSAGDSNADPLSALPPQDAIGASLGLNKDGNRPVYSLGEPMRVGFQVGKESNVVVIETRADGSTVQLFPNRYMSSAAVSAGQQILVPPAGQGDMEADGPKGPRRIRLIAAPTDVDLLKMDLAHTGALAGKVSVVEREYVVGAAK